MANTIREIGFVDGVALACQRMGLDPEAGQAVITKIASLEEGLDDVFTRVFDNEKVQIKEASDEDQARFEKVREYVLTHFGE
jgi:hypothetical protein